MEVKMKKVNCNLSNNSSCEVLLVKPKPIVPGTPQFSSVLTFHTPIHSVHSYQLEEEFQRSGIRCKPVNREIIKREKEMWNETLFGKRSDSSSNQQLLSYKDKDHVLKRMFFHPGFVFVTTFIFTVCLTIYGMKIYNTVMQNGQYTEENSQLALKMSQHQLTSLTTWIYKTESEMKFMKNNLRLMQSELSTVVKELTREDSKVKQFEHQQARLDPLAQLLGPLADFAAEKNGGSILATPDTYTYYPTPAVASIYIVRFYTSIETSPSTILKGVIQPGDCWAYHGSVGRIAIKLAKPIQVSAISIEHIPEVLSINGNINSAPKHFHVMGVTKDLTEAVFLGDFEYDKTGLSRQTFYIDTLELSNERVRTFEAVEIRFLSNHGNQDYTCIYRVRVHGNSGLDN